MGTELRRPNTKIRIMSSFAPASDAATATARPHFHVKDIFVSEKAPCLGATKFHYAQCGTTGSRDMGSPHRRLWSHVESTRRDGGGAQAASGGKRPKVQ